MLEGSSWSRQRLVDALEALSSMEDWVVEVFSPSSSSELEELMVPYSGAADSRDWEPHALQWSLMIKSSDYYPQCWKILLQLPLQRLIQCVASFAPEHKTSVSFNLFCSSKQPMTNKSNECESYGLREKAKTNTLKSRDRLIIIITSSYVTFTWKLIKKLNKLILRSILEWVSEWIKQGEVHSTYRECQSLWTRLESCWWWRRIFTSIGCVEIISKASWHLQLLEQSTSLHSKLQSEIFDTQSIVVCDGLKLSSEWIVGCI